MKFNTDFGYYFLTEGLLRIPSMPFDFCEINDKVLLELLRNNQIQEAIYLASPYLLSKTDEVARTKDRSKLVLYKYIQRMQNRATPFGLFASSGHIKIRITKTNKTKFNINNGVPRRITKLDFYYLLTLSSFLSKQEKQFNLNLKYYTNNTIYHQKSRLRFIEYLFSDSNIRYQLSTVNRTDELETILGIANNGITRNELIDHLNTLGITPKESTTFANKLIKSGLLLDELFPLLTDDDYLTKIRNVISKKSPLADGIAVLLEKTDFLLKKLDTSPNFQLNIYEKIYEKISSIENVPVKRDKLFNVVSHYNWPNKLELPEFLYNELLTSINLLNQISNDEPNNNFTIFKEAFYSRYHDQAVQLIVALDPESGIGYHTNNEESVSSHLLDEIGILVQHDQQSKPSSDTPNPFLYKILLEAFKSNSEEISLDIKKFEDNPPAWDRFPESMNLLFNLFSSGDGGIQIKLDGLFGPSSLTMLSRFSAYDKKIRNLCNKIAMKEVALNKDIIMCDIVHLPEARTGNIAYRSSFERMEIPIVTRSSKKKIQQVKLSDIYIAIVNDKIILFSKKYKKEIKPRLSNAHNFSKNTIPVYRFLADIQHKQSKGYLIFDWGELFNQFSFFPRISYKNVILSPKIWKIENKYFSTLIDMIKTGYNKTTIISWRKKHNLPKCFYLIDDDMQQFVNSTEEISIYSFIDSIKNRSTIIIQEILGKSTPIKDNNGNSFRNEILWPMLKMKSNSKDTQLDINNILSPSIEKHSIGSNWVYFKIYGGPNFLDNQLLPTINTLANDLVKNKTIIKWFFVRYADPEFHLRIRFLLKENKNGWRLIKSIQTLTSTYLKENIVQTIRLDVYHREIKRYGSKTINYCEDLFYHDSLTTATFLATNNNTSTKRWEFGIALIDYLLDSFNYKIYRKFQLISYISISFIREFGLSKKRKVKLDKFYRKNRATIEDITNKSLTSSTFKELLEHKKVLDQHPIKRIRQILSKNSTNYHYELDNLVDSLIHMSLNRLFQVKPRENEFILYYLMAKHYKSLIARNN